MELLIGILLAICGGWGLIAALRAGDSSEAEVTWIEVSGVIASSAVGDNYDTYSAEVTYDFTLNGATLVGKTVRRSPGPWGTRREAEQTVAKYRPGSPVLVYVNAKDPGDTVLERPPRADPPRLAIMLFGTVFIVGFAMIVLGAVR